MKKPQAPTKTTADDGRADAKPADAAKFAAFASDTGRSKRVEKATASLVTSTVIAHQSGQGTRGIRESFANVSKTALIRWCAAAGLNRAKVRVFINSAFECMTDQVFAKNWRAGESGDAPEISRETATKVKALCK